MYELSTFDNGLRLVTVSMPHAYSISTGIYLAVGSRFEDPQLAGASHFIEHMLFKGTVRRPTPRDIAFAIESVGGDINAGTGREMTSYYARVSRDHLRVAADVLTDMVLNSRFEVADIQRERQVIVEEINESLDIPDELVHIHFLQLLWPDHPLGHDVAGTRESVRGLDRDGLLAYMAAGYSPQNAVVAVAGPVSHSGVRDLVGPLLGDWEGGPPPRFQPAPAYRGSIAQAVYRPVEQCHFLLGTPALSRLDDDRFALALLNVILGEGMSSRLFTVIREELGLAYSVYSYTTQLADTGIFSVYAGVDSENLEPAIRATLEQLQQLRDTPVTAQELSMAKAYARGRTLLRLEDSGANAGWVGSQLAMTDMILTPDMVLERIDAVTAEDIQNVARRLFRDDALVLSIVGPVDEEADWSTFLKVE